jgi:hypothetical protein
VRPEGLCKRKSPIIASEIELSAFRFVVQCLNQLRLNAREKHQLFFANIYLTNVAKLPKFAMKH